MNSEPDVQECDATGDAKSTAAGTIKSPAYSAGLLYELDSSCLGMTIELSFRKFATDHIQRTTGLKPLDLLLVVAMVDGNGFAAAIFVVEDELQLLAGGKGEQAFHINAVVFEDLVVVFFVGKRDGEHTLLLEVGFVDTGK